MKKGIAIFLFLMILLALTACDNSEVENSKNTESTQSNLGINTGSATVAINYNEETNTEPATEREENIFDIAKVASSIEVQGEVYSTSYTNYLVLILTNNSNSDCDVSVDVDFFDAAGNIVGTKSKSEEAFARGTSIAFDFSCDDEFQKYEYTITPTKLKYYKCVDQNLECKVNIATEKAIISVTNHGDINAQFVEYRVLFYNNGKLVDIDWGYVTDKDSEIKAGATQKDEAHCYEDFDSVKVYLHGRSDFDY